MIATDSRSIPPVPIRRFTVEEYHQLIDSGILTPEDRLELLDGWLVPKVTNNPPHAGTISVIQSLLLPVVPQDHMVRVQLPITLPTSEPEPDLAVVVGPPRRYLREHPKPRDVGLIIEVADTSLPEDQGIKLELYARSRIPIYWIVNLNDEQIEVYANPRAGRSPTYRNRQDFGADDEVPLVLANQQITTFAGRDLLP